MADRLTTHKDRYASWKVAIAAVPFTAAAFAHASAPSESDTVTQIVEPAAYTVSLEVNTEVAPPKPSPRITFETKFGCDPKTDFEKSQHTNPKLPNYVNANLLADFKKISQGAYGIPAKTLDISCLRTGHTTKIAGTDKISDHSTGNAGDVYAINGRVANATNPDTEILVEEALNHAGELNIKQVISSVPKDKLAQTGTANLDRYQFDPVAHANHVHLATNPDTHLQAPAPKTKPAPRQVPSQAKPEVTVLPPKPLAAKPPVTPRS